MTAIYNISANSIIRSSEQLIGSPSRIETLVAKSVLDNLPKFNIDKYAQAKAFSLLQSCRFQGSLIATGIAIGKVKYPVFEMVMKLAEELGYTLVNSSREVKYPLFETVMKLAEELGFTNAEKAFIQFHIIGGRRYIFVGVNHINDKFEALREKLILSAAENKYAYFLEGVCSDPKSEKDHWEMIFHSIGMKVHGLEDAGRPLITAALLYRDCKNSTPYNKKHERNGHEGNGSEAQKDPHSYEFLHTGILSFLQEMLFNQPWEEAFFGVMNALPNDKTKELFKEIMDAAVAEVSLKEKTSNLYIKLINKYEKAVWADLFQGIAKHCLKVAKVASCFSPYEVAITQKLLENPQDKICIEAFSSTIVLAYRDRSFAHALFTVRLPKEIVRIASFGYSHMPGVIRELEQLSATHLRKK